MQGGTVTEGTGIIHNKKKLKNKLHICIYIDKKNFKLIHSRFILVHSVSCKCNLQRDYIFTIIHICTYIEKKTNFVKFDVSMLKHFKLFNTKPDGGGGKSKLKGCIL